MEHANPLRAKRAPLNSLSENPISNLGLTGEAKRQSDAAGRYVVAGVDQNPDICQTPRTSGRVSNPRKKVAESKSDRFRCKINVHSEKLRESSPGWFNSLALISELSAFPASDVRAGADALRRRHMLALKAA